MPAPSSFTTAINDLFLEGQLKLGGNSFFVVSTIPIFDSSGTNVMPVMINPGLHCYGVRESNAVKSNTLIDGI